MRNSGPKLRTLQFLYPRCLTEYVVQVQVLLCIDERKGFDVGKVFNRKKMREGFDIAVAQLRTDCQNPNGKRL